LRASWTTGQPLAGSPRGIDQRCVHDLDECAVSARQSS
jgi:hypothetical protein